MDGLLCHCGEDGCGHEVAADGCVETMKRGNYKRPWPESAVWEYGRPATAKLLAASGTCPECGRTGVKVVRLGTYAETASGKRGALLQAAPAVAPHRRPGRGGGPCSGAGRVPAETRYTPGRELASWVEVNGADSLAS